MNDFERELERELQRILDPIAAAAIPARRVTTTGGTMKRLLGGAGAALGMKVVTGLAVAAMAATAAGVATEIATTGSINPADWGQQVTKQVQTCKDTLRASGTRGIGHCVSQFAKQHGDAVSDQHQASQAREHGNGNAGGKDNDKQKHQGAGPGGSGAHAKSTPGAQAAGESHVPGAPASSPQP
ncbi:hypothetical protein EPN29_05455 [bacterium]|nr:MAG: hypothetical protein EPN29_05455 [bacterium]